MNRKINFTVIFILMSLSFNAFTGCQNQPPKGPGDNLPAEWGNEKNVRWTYDLAGRGWSSPVIYGNMVFVTTAFNETKPPAPEVEKPETPQPPPPPPAPAPANPSAAKPQVPPPPRVQVEDTTYKAEVWRLEITCLNLKTGKEIWKQVAFKGSPRSGSHKGNGYAAETPVTDGKYIYAYFGMTGIFCYDLKGNLIWEKDLGAYKTLNSWGTGSSPALYNNKVFLQIDNEVNSFIVALDALTGEEKWRVARDEKTTYSTPFIWKNSSRTELVTCGKIARSYDPETGKVIWEMKMKGDMSIPTPVADNDHLYIGNIGEDDKVGGLYSIKAGATGDISPDTTTMVSSGVEWYSAKAPLENPSPVLYNGLIYLLAGNGKNLSCIEAATGKTVYDQKLEKVSSCWATPWVYKDNLYITDERGFTTVVKTGDKFEVLSQNRIRDKFWASAALGYDAYVFKGVNKLYCISLK